MIAIATALHALAAVIWVGGMFFAYMALRPALGENSPAERIGVWRRTFPRFFTWVWASVIVLLVTGYWIIFVEWGGFAVAGIHVHVMHMLGLIMVLLFLHLFFAPWRRMRRAADEGDLAEAGRQTGQIRIIVAINLVLGLIVVAIGAGGRYW